MPTTYKPNSKRTSREEESSPCVFYISDSNAERCSPAPDLAFLPRRLQHARQTVRSRLRAANWFQARLSRALHRQSPRQLPLPGKTPSQKTSEVPLGSGVLIDDIVLTQPPRR